MIGVICKKEEKEIVEEFFQLFKTPWEFYRSPGDYDVIICTELLPEDVSAKVVFLYGDKENNFDTQFSLSIESWNTVCKATFRNRTFPLYCDYGVINGGSRRIINIADNKESIGVAVNRKGQEIYRIGYSLFREVQHVLTLGQPPDLALCPTIEIHVAIIRSLILEAGLPVIEIPPVPKGYRFMCCLTHDVDFLGFKRHLFDHTMFGFFYRALFISLIETVRGRCSLRKLFANWKAAFSVPAMYLGKTNDFWIQFDRYTKMEGNLPSTFYFVPFKNKGSDNENARHAKRKCKYDVSDAEQHIKYLIDKGREIGVHGIDSWMDASRGRAELNQVRKITGEKKIGIRMHWLYFSEDTPRYLEEAGFYYDSTVGYNDAVGYRAGTAQVYSPLAGMKILELPLHIQDTALFYPRRMHLKESEALKLVEKLVVETSTIGGVLVINWHHRSIGPERFWDEFYLKLLGLLKKHGACFMSAVNAVKWFQERRQASFKIERRHKETVEVGVRGTTRNAGERLILRVYNPSSYQKIVFPNNYSECVDFSIREEISVPCCSQTGNAPVNT